MKANKATCPDGHEYLVNHQSAECPHERFVDLIVNKPSEGRLLTEITNYITGFSCGITASWDGCGDCEGLKEGEVCKGATEVAKELIAKTASLKDAEHQQKVREIFEYECKDCSTPGFRHLVIPEKVASGILGGK